MSFQSPPLFRLVVLGGIATLAGFLLGVDLAVINGTVVALTHSFGASSSVIGVAISVALLGSGLGALGAGQLADRFGRKPLMLGIAILFIGGTWGVGAAHSMPEFSVFRFLGGVAAGGGSVVTPAYLAEIAPAAIRGRLIIIQQLAIVIGIVATFLSNFVIAHAAGGTDHVWLLGFPAWRWMFWWGLLPSFGYLASAFLVPESPRYLVGKGRGDAAQRVMTRLWGPAFDVEKTIAEIRTTLRREHAARFADLCDASRRFRLLPIVWIGLGLGFCQQSNGINVVLYYGEVLWRTVGYTSTDALLINVLVGGALLLATCVSMTLIDRIGRRPLLLLGSITMTATLAALTLIFASSPSAATDPNLVLSPAHAAAALVVAHLFIFFYGASWAPVTWVLLGEMFPNKIRGGGIALGGSAVWFTNFAVTATFPYLLQHIGLTFSYAIYTSFAALSLFFVLRWVPETRGRALEAMQEGIP